MGDEGFIFYLHILYAFFTFLKRQIYPWVVTLGKGETYEVVTGTYQGGVPPEESRG